MRISTAQMFQSGLDGILDQQTRVFKDQQQISTGRRIVSPADDPAGAARVLDLTQVHEATRQYNANADAADERLRLEDTTLGSAVDVLQRARELAVQGLNDSQNADDRQAIASEVHLLVDQMLQLANAKDATGEYLFAGFQGRSGTEPFSHDGTGTFTYNGDQGQRSVQIGPNQTVPVSDSGAKVFMKVPASGGGYQDVFTTLRNLATGLEADNPDSAALTDIDNAMQNLLDVQAETGTRRNAVDVQRDLGDSLMLQAEESRSAIRDLDYAEAVTRFNRHMLSLQFAQKSFSQVQGLSLFQYI